MTQISVNFGILLAQMLAIKWNSVESWRRILSVGWIIAGFNIILAATSLVESPKWLVIRSKHANEELGIKILGNLRGSTSSVQDVHNEIEIWKIEKQGHLLLLESNPHLKNLGFWYYLTDKNYLNSRMIATFMMIGQQFAGINSVIFYGVDILNKVFPQYAVLANVLISVGNMVITAVASTFLDRVGRKPLLLISLLSMLVSLVVLSAGILMDKSLITSVTGSVSL
ncbi:hypothetical protein PMKS-003787 [Pichia membranifaciens]|uniref:Major facilitator superfamily (MFS) profile domain-containing protein n=1 Tax=Pichia membranifaciens TaxID=4926 RepID=A0A1Q2YL44_9ASCO|nr:hypothetical protein PMKS-003787 [Pichia membranifaciens]